MNIYKHLIFIKGEDKTDQVEECTYEKGKWKVNFSNSNRVFTYNYDNVEKFYVKEMMDPSYNIVYQNTQPISGIKNIIVFDNHVRLIFGTGYKNTYKLSEIRIEQSALGNQKAKSCFEYLKELSNHVSVKGESERSFLNKQYSSISNISPNSVLAAYLERKPFVSYKNELHPIFPFGFNLSQKSATEKALKEQVSVIEGPPGTGKTQTILNIISNAIIENKTVAVVSNNNSATANVLEKLDKYGVGFLAAYLGNKDNKEKFFSEQVDAYPNMDEWSLSPEEYQQTKTELREAQTKLDSILDLQNRRAKLKSMLSDLKTEQQYFNQYYAESNFSDIKFRTAYKIKADKVLRMLIECKHNSNDGKLGFKSKIYNFFVYGVYNFKFYKNTSEVIISFLQKLYYESKISELKRKIDRLSERLENYNFENAMKDYSQSSMELLRAKLADKYVSNGQRASFTKDVLWKNFERFIGEYPVILSTTHSLRSCASKDYLFDYVIVDEASQVDIVTGALALSCARNAVIVGDEKQLPNVVPSEIASITDSIFTNSLLDSSYQYSKHSLLTSVLSLFEDIPRTLLREHYRCHPKIINFCNQKFYNNELVILTDEDSNETPLILYKTAKGNHARGKINQRQIDVVIQEILPSHQNAGTIGIISPYRDQADELVKAIKDSDIEADTVHKFQGRERDVVVLTTVSNEVIANDFVDDPNLINVAVSRAVDKLIVVVSEGSEKWKGTNIGDLIRYMQYNNFEQVESQIYSVFDLLYSGYSDELLKVLKSSKKVSDYASENLMNMVIEKVLNSPEFRGLDRVLHQPLRMLIKDTSKLSEEERQYAMNILTHTDFVIFNKVDKMPVLVVEVDGHAYHADNPKQLKRDKMKDEILAKYDIPILRMKTTESDEEKRLKEKLGEVMGREV
ncbi:AAA domain-containing protein [Bacillaceae bacterium S4-13-56]